MPYTGSIRVSSVRRIYYLSIVVKSGVYTAMSDALVNRVASSGLITLKPEEWAPSTQPQVFDLKDYLFMALILKEQDFRDSMKTHDWSQYKDKVLCVFCSTDAIIPSWGYMVLSPVD